MNNNIVTITTKDGNTETYECNAFILITDSNNNEAKALLQAKGFGKMVYPAIASAVGELVNRDCKKRGKQIASCCASAFVETVKKSIKMRAGIDVDAFDKFIEEDKDVTDDRELDTILNDIISEILSNAIDKVLKGGDE